jgi:hypothetical protein
MSSLETFITFGFISTFAVALLATWFRYLPNLISLYLNLGYQSNQPSSQKYGLDKLMFSTVNYGQAKR